MKYRIELTRQYIHDVKLARKRHLDESKLNEIIRMLAEGLSLPSKNKDHSLKGDYANYRECHISPDWLLIYNINDSLEILRLVRTGTHSDLF